MIRLTRLSGEAFILNADLIQYVESRPDTFIKLTTGDRVIVAESDDEVLRRAVAYQQSKNLIPAPSPSTVDTAVNATVDTAVNATVDTAVNATVDAAADATMSARRSEIDNQTEGV